MDYAAACKRAADEQGITAIIDYLTLGDIPAQAWQTGGFCMVAAIKLDLKPDNSSDHYIMVTDETYHTGENEWLACRYEGAECYEAIDECAGDPATVARWIVSQLAATR